jgi:LmbE family N-acetylglucosaminyl deacetylase
MTRTTIIWATHPDDETLYTSGYVRYCVGRGDRLILVAITDGGASGAKPAAWTTADLMRVRREEQERAWYYLTNGRGEIRRMGLPDGGVTSAPITNLAAAMDDIYLNDTVEHYYTGHLNSASADHKNGAIGMRDAGLRVLRGTFPPSEFTWDGVYGAYTPDAGSADYDAANQAYYSYRAFGWTSVKSEFTKLKSNGFTSKTTTIV